MTSSSEENADLARPTRLRTFSILLRLRYKLLWANVRSRNGKTILFIVGYLFVMVSIVLVSLLGFGTALASSRMGEAGQVARMILGSFYTLAIICSVVLGVGINPLFSDPTLRRYPLSSFERIAARQLTALAEPLWILILALDLSVALGYNALQLNSLWLAAPAAACLAFSNFAIARLLSKVVELVSATRIGLVALIVFLSVGIPLVALLSASNLAPAHSTILPVIKMTPPFAAAAVMTTPSGWTSFGDVALLLGWCLGLGVILVVFDRTPTARYRSGSQEASWGGLVDHFAALFGPAGPLVSKTLRFYLRSNRTRITYFASVPIVIVVVQTWRGRIYPMENFSMALGALAAIGFSCSFVMSANAFGYDRAGFRRYFLLPVSPWLVLAALNIVPLLLGFLISVTTLLAWLIFSPVQHDWRMLIMLASSSIGGLFFFQAVGVWTSLLAPTKSAFAATFSNDLSLPAMVAGQGGGLGAILLGLLVYKAVGELMVVRYWWLAPSFIPVATTFYVFTLHFGASVLRTHREHILSVVEAND